jgi:hypothetical protein
MYDIHMHLDSFLQDISKTIYLPNTGVRAGKTMAKNSFRNRNLRQIKMQDSYKDNVHIMGRN